jgi:8-oxo-dGTP diphosphatase
MKTREYCYEYPRPALSTDCVIFGFDGIDLNILLIERGGDPFKGYWALPGGFVQIDENAEESARRELTEETGMKNVFLEQLHTFTDVNRHPAMRVITVAYFSLVRTAGHQVKAGDDANKVEWVSLNDVPSLAFDHNQIISMAKSRLENIISHKPAGSHLFYDNFSDSDLELILKNIKES